MTLVDYHTCERCSDYEVGRWQNSKEFVCEPCLDELDDFYSTNDLDEITPEMVS